MSSAEGKGAKVSGVMSRNVPRGILKHLQQHNDAVGVQIR